MPVRIPLWVAALLSLISLFARADDFTGPENALWPQWRGPNRDGFDPSNPWPSDVKPDHFKPLWRVELGPSYSGPVTSQDLVFTTETHDEREEIVTAFDRGTGREVWRRQWEGAMKVPFFAAKNGSWIRSTPAFDGDALYVGGIREVFKCLDAKTGEVRWSVDFPSKFSSPLPDFGFVCSPLVVGDHLYVQAGAGFVKLDKKTGETLWQSMKDGGGMYKAAFSSPVMASIGGINQVVVQSRERLAGIDPADGRELWTRTVPAFRGMNILTPTVYKDSVFTSTYQGQSWLFKLDKSGEGFIPVEAWKQKSQGYMSTPVVIKGHAYLHLENRRFTCINLDTGEEKWRTSERFGEYWSMIAQGDRILALDESGEILLIRANPERFELIDRRQISEASTWAHIAKAGDQVFIRELNALAAYAWK